MRLLLSISPQCTEIHTYIPTLIHTHTWGLAVVVDDRVEKVAFVSTQWITSHPVLSQDIIATWRKD